MKNPAFRQKQRRRYTAGMSFDIRHGDCREVMAAMDAESVDSIVSDPPYGLSAAKNSGKSSSGGFMGK